MMDETSNRRRVYAMRRLSLAVDRAIRGENPEKARKWAEVWAIKAGIKPPEDRLKKRCDFPLNID
jgi:hypothetical protein